jgi:hypothetical protein
MSHHSDNGQSHLRQNEWRDYRLLVLKKLDELDGDLKDHAKETKEGFAAINSRLSEIETDLAMHKTKLSIIGGVWGFLAGIASSVIATLFVLFVKK